MGREFILRTKDLSKEFSGFFAVQNVNIEIQKGSIHALIGPNGAGKTTCFNLLTKFHKPSGGNIIFDGKDITTLDPADVATLGIVRSFQISAVFPHLTALENVRIALQRERGNSFDFWRSNKAMSIYNERAMALLEDVGIQSFAKHKAVEMPYGRKRALEIATTLALNPKVLLLDEPMAGMGIEDIDRITVLIRRISTDRTILMVEHNLKVVADLANTITVMARGQVIAEGDYDSVSSDREVQRAYIGGSHE
jgi:branched-chain amino acid transport system ATP-binding protein